MSPNYPKGGPGDERVRRVHLVCMGLMISQLHRDPDGLRGRSKAPLRSNK